ncbi:tripartite tricarboxylate transporter substrate binding protein [Bordetella bronchiseptica]|uniref:Bug family tripartite tricarboxylate transporter substrate binding protein n=1 Tax=Bordetella bronchiseptica TaxID=518 RepID=UPI003F748E9F
MKSLFRSLSAVTLTLAVVAPQALAQDAYPTRPIRIVVPYPAGSALESVARTVSQTYNDNLGQPAVIMNKPGGSGIIGTQEVARAQPDGYTLLLGTNQTHGANSALYPNLPYDALGDFTPIAGLARMQHVLVVRKNLGVDSVRGLIELANKPGANLNVGSSGNGSASHLVAEMFMRSADVKMAHIPYKGSGEVAQGLLGGFVDVSFATLPSVLPFIKDGSIVALAVASKDRAPQLDSLPTLAQEGVRDVEADAWTALFAPAGTPPAVLAKVSAVTIDAFKDPGVVEKVGATGFVPEVTDGAAFKAFLAQDMQRWADVIKAANVKLD